MSTFISKIIPICASVLLLFSCTKETAPSYPKVGDPLPMFSLNTNNGLHLSYLHLQNMNCIFVFFHTECPDCQKELPVIDEYVRLHPKKIVYAISRAEKDSDIQTYWRQNNLSIKYSAQPDRSIYDLFTDSGIPYVVVSKKGIITAIFTDKDQLTLEMMEDLL